MNGLVYYVLQEFTRFALANLRKFLPKVSYMTLFHSTLFCKVENIIEKGIRKIMYYVWMNKGSIDETVLNERRKDLADELKIWEGLLSSPFVAGDEFTMADVFFFHYLAMFVRGSLSFEGRPNLGRYYEEVSKRPSVAASWPPHFKYTPPTQAFVAI